MENKELKTVIVEEPLPKPKRSEKEIKELKKPVAVEYVRVDSSDSGFHKQQTVNPSLDDMYGRLGIEGNGKTNNFEMTNPLAKDASGRRLDDFRKFQNRKEHYAEAIPEQYVNGMQNVKKVRRMHLCVVKH